MPEIRPTAAGVRAVSIVAAILALVAALVLPDAAGATEWRPGDPTVRPSPDAGSTSATVAGIDVANYQHPGGAPIDWNQVRGAGNEYVFIKATEGPVSCTGSYYRNPYFEGDWRDSGAAGMYRGAYHFARPRHPLQATAVDQARYFVGITGPMTGPKDLPPVLDFEVTCGLSPAELAAWAHYWLDEVERLTGRKSAITTYASFWSGPMANNTTFGDYPLWFARYGTPSPYPLPAGWDDWTWWQTGQAYEPGIVGEVDQNLFNGNLAFLARYGATSSPYPTSPIGSFETVKPLGRGDIVVSGWTLDADTQDPITVDIWVDGVLRATPTADEYRADVGAFFWIWGPYHGFSTPIDGLTPGGHEVCVWAHNTGPGINSDLGCRTVVNEAPIGFRDRLDWLPGGPEVDPDPLGGLLQLAIDSAGAMRIVGWTLDPDTADSLAVSISIDGATAATGVADVDIPVLGQFFTGFGSRHGFDLSTRLPAGLHQVCVTAHNVGAGTDTVLGCGLQSGP